MFCCDIHSSTSQNLHLSSDQYQRNFGSTWRSPEKRFADLFKLFECGSLTQQLLFSVSHLLPQSMEVASSCSLVSTSNCSQRRSWYNYTYCGQWTTTCTRAPFRVKVVNLTSWSYFQTHQLLPIIIISIHVIWFIIVKDGCYTILHGKEFFKE